MIGCGRIAPNHIMAALDNKLEITALCDVEPDRAKRLCERFSLGATVYSDYRKMLCELSPEFVAIATESGSHAKIAQCVIENGCNVIIEKPIALSVSDAEKIVSLGKEHGVKVSTCHQNRFNLAAQRAHFAIQEGRLGKISHAAVTVRWSRGAPITVRQTGAEHGIRTEGR